MNLPPALMSAIAVESERADTRTLTAAATELSVAYRAQQPRDRQYITTDAHRVAYATVRMPATYAAVRSALERIHTVLPDPNLTSLLDLGSGPGTAAWATLDAFPSVENITLVEQDTGLIALGRSLAESGHAAHLLSADWQAADLTQMESFPQTDLITLSYAIGEFSNASIGPLLEAAWSATRSALLIVEPGTVPGFGRIRTIRDRLIELGACIAAPCPHADACPMSADDWCHFSQRLDRSSHHRQIKSGSIGHEDEKFAYIVATKESCSSASARVLRHPQRRSGHTHLSLCTREGLRQVTVTRSQKSDWKRVRRLSWGDAW